MTLSTEMRKLRESKAFYAVAGASDLAVEKLREVPVQLRRTDNIKGARRELSGRAQSYAVALSGKAAQVYGDLGSRAAETYESLAERGKTVVSRTGRAAAEAKEEITSQAASTGRAAQQTADSARKTAETTGKAASATRDAATGRSSATRTESAKKNS